MGNKCLDCTALTLTIIGAINWGLIGFFRFDLVAFLFGDICWHFTGIVDVIYKSFFLLIIHGKKGQAMAYAII